MPAICCWLRIQAVSPQGMEVACLAREPPQEHVHRAERALPSDREFVSLPAGGIHNMLLVNPWEEIWASLCRGRRVPVWLGAAVLVIEARR